MTRQLFSFLHFHLFFLSLLLYLRQIFLPLLCLAISLIRRTFIRPHPSLSRSILLSAQLHRCARPFSRTGCCPLRSILPSAQLHRYARPFSRTGCCPLR
ncbi:hypothetical protein BJV78DRAFT_1219139 [Lactifluus subvellereus]|nr:hypothetical protein BJV78DRAFT_1219139 [Lactifluus subvellereus]